ncbi:unnamed protein product [Rangifer tarandus platyrhynchus]|uniref:Secreted protein n=1 Tax=Rangifer tarandus platyrhynchus TaxID=3082113 RepID=A0ABN8YRI3_RANTA|nr:unnamed protein product [Rangifer tarandus platyrhynchus]
MDFKAFARAVHLPGQLLSILQDSAHIPCSTRQLPLLLATLLLCSWAEEPLLGFPSACISACAVRTLICILIGLPPGSVYPKLRDARMTATFLLSLIKTCKSLENLC